ncbi:hypothetical protein [Wohlfahrtiimonas chitiniclastica]|uniref:hypothetical protein n=1 Tax=Wohlfahrtiimonas chitiniclastica TaxID=400946 RepID=UPI00164AA7F5|nr:hypothetical protein [Wohlfahrtiimonas chitiniclastica]
MIKIKNITNDGKTTTFDIYKVINGKEVYQSTDTLYKVFRTERSILKALGD